MTARPRPCCVVCGGPLPTQRGSGRRFPYCSDDCRLELRRRRDRVVAELLEPPRLSWELEPERDG